MKKLNLLQIILYLVLMVLILVGCESKNDNLKEPELEEKGLISLNMSLEKIQNTNSYINSIHVTIEGPTNKEGNLTISADSTSATGEFTNLIPGDYTINVVIYNSSNDPLANGSAEAKVKPGEITKVTITMLINTGGLDITIYWSRMFVLEGQSIRGLCYNDSALWVTHSLPGVSNTVKISKINTHNGQVLLESSNLNYNNGRGITVGNGNLWISDAYLDDIHQLDSSDFSEISSFNTPGTEPNGIAFDGSDIWLLDPYFEHIYKLSTSGTTINSFVVPRYEGQPFPTALEWEDSGLWTDTDSTEVSFYTTDGTITSSEILDVIPEGQYIYDIALGEGKVFISTGLDTIYIQNWNK